MRTWCKGVALAAAWLGLGVPAWAQGYAPQPVGAARMAEPLSCGHTEAPPNLQPGPPPPPPVDPNCNSLPAGHSSAFQCEDYALECRPYFSAGAIGLRRASRVSNNPLAFRDPLGIDTGLPIPFPSPPDIVIARPGDVNPHMAFGPKATFGWLFNDEAIEITGFWIPGEGAVRDFTLPGQINVPFFNPPLGFEGNNGLWLQADRLRTTFHSGFWNAEVNYRRWNLAVNGIELILGVRYLNLREDLTIFTDDEGVVRPDIFGRPDPRRQATYRVNSINQVVAPQFGGEYSFPAFCTPVGTFSLGASAKVALGVNFVDRDYSLKRGDGFPGYRLHRKNIAFGQIYDASAFVEWHILEKFRVRAGYNVLWVGTVSWPDRQLNFDLSAQGQTPRDSSMSFYHGPTVELEFLF
jgi:hypothetical protein